VADATTDFRPEVRRVLPAIIGVRFVINVAMRMGYTFLPAFARGAGLSVGTMSVALSARELTALTAPQLGRASDRLGPIRVMAVGGIVAALGLLIATLGSLGLVVGLLVLGFGRTAHQVALNAWVGREVAYERRGRVTGIIELTWGGASLIGLPLVGLLLGWTWWLPLLLLGVATLGLSLRMRAHEGHIMEASAVSGRKPHMTRPVIAAVATNGALAASAQFLFLAHGLWLEDAYDLDAQQVGFAVVGVGVVEVAATTASSRLTDGFGKRRSILFGAAVMTAAMFALAVWSEPPLIVGLLLLVTAFVGFEFAIVSAIPLISELDPGARAQMVGRAMGFTTFVRAAVTLIATSLYLTQGFGVVMTTAGLTGIVAVGLAAFAMVEPSADSAH
jgi:predicted MFS family arabinose efflux permease